MHVYETQCNILIYVYYRMHKSDDQRSNYYLVIMKRKNKDPLLSHDHISIIYKKEN